MDHEVPVPLVGADVVISVITFFAYGADKAAAEEGRWRTSESTLHLLAPAGGWPGALVAQRVFRHKTTKRPFRTVFWVTVVVSCAALTWVVTEAPLTSL